MRKLVLALAALTLVITVMGCQPTPPVQPVKSSVVRTRTPTAVPANDEDAIKQIINAEGEAVTQQDIDRLQAMWVSDGVVTDANNTASNTSDDKTWSKWGAIRDRYVNIVFPSSAVSEHPNIRVTLTGDTASAMSDSKIGITNAKDNDKWTLRKMDGQWKITSLTFGLAPK
jgi:ketosteroid isomerase-like protein